MFDGCDVGNVSNVNFEQVMLDFKGSHESTTSWKHNWLKSTNQSDFRDYWLCMKYNTNLLIQIWYKRLIWNTINIRHVEQARDLWLYSPWKIFSTLHKH